MKAVNPQVPRLGTCIFCGNYGRLTDEDAIPEWLMTFLFPHGTLTAMTSGRAEQLGANIKFGMGQRVKVRVLCEDCNGIKWLGSVEKRIKPKLLAWMAGIHGPLGVEDQQLLAFWTTKTALMIQLAETWGTRTIPNSYYGALHALRDRPPEGVNAWAGLLRKQQPGIRIGQSMQAIVPRDVRSVFNFEFRMRRLFLAVIGIEPPASIAPAGLPQGVRTVVRTWPAASQLLTSP